MWFWSKKQNQSAKPSTSMALVPDTASRSVLARQGQTTVAKYRISSLIAPGMLIRGNVEVAESLMVLGEIDGGVHVTGKGMVLLLKEGGRVTGTAKAASVLVAGEVHGDVVGGLVRLYSTAVVHGSLRARRLIIDDGAIVLNEKMDVSELAELEEDAAPPQKAQPEASTSDWHNVAHLSPRDRLNMIRARACVGA